MTVVYITVDGLVDKTIYDLPVAATLNDTDVFEILRSANGSPESLKVPLLSLELTWSGYTVFTGGAEFSTTSAYGTVVTMKGTNADAGPIMRRQWSPTVAPSDFDDIFLEQWYANNDELEEVAVADMFVQWVDVTKDTEDARIGWQTIVAGTKAVRFYMGAGIYADGVTGGDKGAGTINVTAAYDENVLLTCYVIEAFLDGSVDLDRRDSYAPEGKKHVGAHNFAARLGTEYDPLDIDKYIDHWKTKRHLSSLPGPDKWTPHSTGEVIQRLWETVEIQAVHIAQLHDRLAKVERRK